MSDAKISSAVAANLDSLLDSTLDDLADMPEFKPYPAGAHRCIIGWEMKEVNKKPAIQLNLKAQETLELADPSRDQPLAAGTETQILFILRNDDGQRNEIAEGKMKEVLKSLRSHFDATGTMKNKELMEASKGAEVVVVTKVKHNKKNDTYNTDLVSVNVV